MAKIKFIIYFLAFIKVAKSDRPTDRQTDGPKIKIQQMPHTLSTKFFLLEDVFKLLLEKQHDDLNSYGLASKEINIK